MPVTEWKSAFVRYAILAYRDEENGGEWKTSKKNVSTTSKDSFFKFTSPVEQDIIIAMDMQNTRQTGANCGLLDVQYNLYLMADNKTISRAGVSQYLGYGDTRITAEAGKEYILLVRNWVGDNKQ